MMSFGTMVTLATVLLASLVALSPVVAQGTDGKCAGVRFDPGPEPRRAPTNMPADANVLQAVNMTDFAAELRAAGWGQLHLGYDSFIRDHAKFERNEAASYMEPGHHQGNPDDNSVWCVADDADSHTFSRTDAIAQMGRFCGPGSPLHGKVLKGPLSVNLRIQTDPTTMREDQTWDWHWLDWHLYVEDGCEWVHDEEECMKYMHVPLDACSCWGTEWKMGGAVMNRCYGFSLSMAPGWSAYHDCDWEDHCYIKGGDGSCSCHKPMPM